MGITKRFINIVKTNRKDFSDESHLSQSEIENLLADDSADELSNLISEVSKNYFPEHIINAFVSMEMRETNNLELISLQFKNLLNKYHPDKNLKSNDSDKQFLNRKTSEIIDAYNTIKKHLEQ